MSDMNPAVLTATEKTKQALGQAAPWMFFLAVMGYIGCGLLVLIGIGLALIGGSMGGYLDEMGRFGRVVWPILGAVYVGLAVLAFFPTLMLHRIAGKSKAYGKAGGPNDLEGVAVNIRSLAKYWGICTIVLLAVYVVAAIGIIVAVVAMPHSY